MNVELVDMLRTILGSMHWAGVATGNDHNEENDPEYD